MKIFTNNQWIDGFLDYCPQSDEYLIQVLAWKNLEKSSDLYFVRPKSLRLLLNYLKEIGAKEVFKKIISRFQEKTRNEKFISCGIGRIIRQPEHAEFPLAQLVGFLAPNLPACVERVALPNMLISALDEVSFPFLLEQSIHYLGIDSESRKHQAWWSDYRGWSIFSGQCEFQQQESLHQEIIETVSTTDWSNCKQLQNKNAEIVCFSRKPANHSLSKHRKKGVLFGYGNYAKTNIIPNIQKYLNLVQIHEIDPTQVPLQDNLNVTWSTCPFLFDDAKYDVFFIAGFHHTHAPLVITALEQSAYAVVEKPVVVDNEQLDTLVNVMSKNNGRLFSCFHKRYIPMNHWAKEDMKLEHGEPVSYHCIVYEVPLPKHHWYRWPNSKSRLLSNGCHWIDHFLYLNNFSKVKKSDLFIAHDGTINCSVELINGGYFTMTLTDKGSERIGVRDYIELRNKDTSVTMINGGLYQAENATNILRRKKINKMVSYKIMYDKICRAIVEGRDGDSVASVRASSALILELEKKYQNLTQNNRRGSQ